MYLYACFFPMAMLPPFLFTNLSFKISHRGVGTQCWCNICFLIWHVFRPPFWPFLSHHYYYYYLICNAQILLGMWCKTDYFSHYAMFSFASFWVWNWNCKNLFGVYEIWWVGFFMSDSFVCFVHITHKSKVVMYVKAVNTLEESSFDPKILNPSFVNYCK